MQLDDGKYTATEDIALVNRMIKKLETELQIKNGQVTQLNNEVLIQPLDIPEHIYDKFKKN